MKISKERIKILYKQLLVNNLKYYWDGNILKFDFEEIGHFNRKSYYNGTEIAWIFVKENTNEI